MLYQNILQIPMATVGKMLPRALSKANDPTVGISGFSYENP